jgi:hypothetical protein
VIAERVKTTMLKHERKSIQQKAQSSLQFNLENVVHEGKVPEAHNITRDQAIKYLKKLKDRY